MDILLLLIGLVVELLAVPLLLIALIWFFFVGRRFYREKKSLDAFKGNEIAKAMTMDRIKARFIRTLGKILWPGAYDASRSGHDAALRRGHDRQLELAYGGRHRDVRRVPRDS